MVILAGRYQTRHRSTRSRATARPACAWWIAVALRQELLWEDGSSAALARRLITELASLDSTRLRKCARPQCTLLFYDTTRSRTRRWHAEDPCGWRERDHARRATLTTPYE